MSLAAFLEAGFPMPLKAVKANKSFLATFTGIFPLLMYTDNVPL